MTRLAVTLATVAVLVLSTGCVQRPEHSPEDAGIPQARSAAAAGIEQLAAQLTFTDRVEVLAQGTRDDCGTIRNWWFDNSDLGYRCWMSWTAVAVINDVANREDLIAAVEAEVAALDLPFTRGAMLRDYLELYPDQREDMPLGIGGTDGAYGLGISTEPFRPEFWQTPIRAGMVGSAGDVDEPSVADVKATGAAETLTISISTEYWRTEPAEDPGAISDPNQEGVPEGAAIKYWSYGDRYAFDLGSLLPGFPEQCLAKPTVDQASIVRYEQPFARLKFDLVAGADATHWQRVRDCLVPELHPGTTLVAYDPYIEPGSS